MAAETGGAEVLSQQRLSPAALQQQLLAEVQLQEAIHESHMQLAALEQAQSLAGSQQETAAVWQRWQADQAMAGQAEELALQRPQAHNTVRSC